MAGACLASAIRAATTRRGTTLTLAQFRMPDEYRFVGGDLHGQIRVFGGEVWRTFPGGADIDKPLQRQMEVAYEQRAFGSNRGEDEPNLRIDVMLDVGLCRALDADPKDAGVAWALLDAFFPDFPGARQLGAGVVFQQAARRGLTEAMAALKRARRALPKVPTEPRSAWAAHFADNGVDRLKIALDRLDGVELAPWGPPVAQEE